MSKGLLIPRDNYLDPSILWEALRAHEKSAGIGEQAQDSFSFGALRALAFEPLSHPSLHPEKWKKLNAGIDISVHLTKKGSLVIDVSPWPECCNLNANFRGDQFEDFVDFQRDECGSGLPKCTIFELPLDELKSELRGAGMNPGDAAVSARRLVHLSYDHILRKLSGHFQVRVQTALLCVGDECRLLLRKMSTLENEVDRPQRWDESISWHSKFESLCSQAGVAPDELLELYASSLRPLSETERLSFLRQFLGRPSRPIRTHWRRNQQQIDPTERLLRTLTVMASPDVFPPLIGHPSAPVAKHLLRLVTSVPHGSLMTIANEYCLDEAEVQNLVRQHYPEVLLATMVSLQTVRAELEYTVDQRPKLLEMIAELQRRMVLLSSRVWDDAVNETPAVRKRKMCKAVGFGSLQATKDWAERYAPPMLLWLNSL